MRTRTLHQASAPVVGLVLGLVLGMVGQTNLVHASQAPAESQAAPVQLTADLTCLPSGGIAITLSVTNLGHETLTATDLHVFVAAVRQGGPEGVGALFVTPAPDFGVIPPQEERTIRLTLGEPVPGEPPATARFSGQRLLVEVEMFFAGREQPVRRHFSFPACGA